MDIKSIVRAFRYNELQQKADRDPAAKRPPTIKFLAVALFIGVMALGFSLLVMSYEPDSGDGTVLTVSDSTDSTNSTSPAPTSGSAEQPSSQQPPTPVRARSD